MHITRSYLIELVRRVERLERILKVKTGIMIPPLQNPGSVVRTIQTIIASRYGMTLKEMAHSRTKGGYEKSWPRVLAMHFCQNYVQSPSFVAHMFNRKHNRSVKYACRAAEAVNNTREYMDCATLIANKLGPPPTNPRRP